MAIKMAQPIGNSAYGPLLLRIPLGSYFVLAGLLKLENLQGFITEVRGFNILPDHLATLYGILLPYFEIGAGALLILGAWTTLCAMLCSLMLLSFVMAIGPFQEKSKLFNKDIILLGASLSLLYTGAGALSLDGFRKGG